MYKFGETNLYKFGETNLDRLCTNYRYIIIFSVLFKEILYDYIERLNVSYFQIFIYMCLIHLLPCVSRRDIKND